MEGINKGKFDVILLDISLPDSQGIDTFIKTYTSAPNIPIIVMSNLDDESFAVKAVQEGAQDYLVKGCADGNLLARSIRYYIERHQMLKKLEKAQYQLRHLAYHDSLTGLPNRKLFHDHLHRSVAQARRDSKMVAVLFVDLDEFKQINDTLGHDIGDLLLQSVAKRLTDCIRESDITARVGGDEFILILNGINSVQDAAKVAQKIVESLSSGFFLGGHKLTVTSSIGISLFPNDSNDSETLVKNADLAMYNAKEHGRNNYKFFLLDLNN